MPRAIIVGIASVDGSYLSEFLLAKGYDVIGTTRQAGDDSTNIAEIKSKLTLETADLTNYQSISEVIRKYQPTEIYNFAALSLPSESWQQAALTAQVNGFGPVHILESVRNFSPHSKVFQATSREIFGQVDSEFASESTVVKPINPYGASKAYAHFMVNIYRQSHGLYAVSGILFNHESPRRPIAFVTRKITAAVACIKNQIPNKEILSPQGKLELWDLEAPRDRGYAPEFIEAMWLTLQQPTPNDYVIATGETHTLREICEIAFSAAGLDWREHVVVRNSTPLSFPDSVKGDYSRLEKLTGWRPHTSFKELIEIMVASDLHFFR